MDGWIDGSMDGSMDRWIDGSMDGYQPTQMIIGKLNILNENNF